ncbi:GGDEF domain-containing protein [Deinococcus altitudinis]|uniref:GGDEF domain-containing protein n=1 Tax=Deinococcus altitudinis TaxID=468914 RepID=UPI0038916BD3
MKHRAAFPVLRAPSLPGVWASVLMAWLLGDQQLDSSETARVKIRSYAFALLAAAPGLLLILASLLQEGAYAYAALHGAVILGVALMFPLVLLGRMPMRPAERVLAALLVLDGGGFLLMSARYPGQIISFDLLGNILLFIVAGLLLVLPPRLSIALSLCLLAAYRLEVWRLGGESRASLVLAQWVNIGMFALLMVGVVMRQTLAQQAGRVHLLQELALRDTLTGLLNRRGFEEAVTPLRRGGQSGALIVLDIDDFKPINDTHGHIEGDRILEELAGVLRRLAAETASRRAGVCARWGGEEFLLYLPEPDANLTLEFARLLHAEIGAHTATPQTDRLQADRLQAGRPQPGGPPAVAVGAVTVSVGVGEWRPEEPLHHAFLRADTALYDAKRAGKNCVRAAASPSLPPTPLTPTLSDS